MSTRRFCAVVCGVIGAGLLLIHAIGIASAWGNVPLGTKIPELTLTSTSGKSVTITAKGSKAMVLLYLRPNHDRSAKALSDMVQIYKRYSDQGLRVMAVSTVRTAVLAMKQLVKKIGVPFPVLIDSKEQFYGRYGVFIHPTTGVIDATGVLRYEYSSHRKDYTITVERQIRAALGIGPPPDQIVDLDRNAVSVEKRGDQRRAKLLKISQRMELKRARRRFVASRAMLEGGDLKLVFKYYQRWVEKLPLPEDAALAELVPKIWAKQELPALVKKLEPLAAKKPAEVDRWLGRAQAGAGQLEQARTTFERCSKAGDPSGQCDFELARLVQKTDKARAIALCKRAYKRVLGEH